MDYYTTDKLKYAAVLYALELRSGDTDPIKKLHKVGKWYEFSFAYPDIQEERIRQYENYTLPVDARLLFESFEELRNYKYN